MTAETALYLRIRGEVTRFEGRSVVLGRSRSCDVHLDEQGVSRRHCEVLLRDDGAWVRDLGSTHGTCVAGRRVAGEERLRAGAIVTLGEHGPHFDLVNAIVHGHPVLGAAEPASPQGVPDPTIVRQAEAPAEPPVVAAPAGGSRFVSGLVWGLASGLAVGAAFAVLAG